MIINSFQPYNLVWYWHINPLCHMRGVFVHVYMMFLIINHCFTHRCVVLDEADQMLEKGFADTMDEILSVAFHEGMNCIQSDVHQWKTKGWTQNRVYDEWVIHVYYIDHTHIMGNIMKMSTTPRRIPWITPRCRVTTPVCLCRFCCFTHA